MLGSGAQLAADHLAVVSEDGEVRTFAACADDRAADLVSVDVVRPDDDAFTQQPLQGGDQVGEGVSSEVSSEVVPPPADLGVVVAPRRAAQGARVVFAHNPPPLVPSSLVHGRPSPDPSSI